MPNIRAIQSPAEHEMLLSRIGKLMGAQPDTPEFAELLALAEVVETYEARHFPIARPTPVEAIRFRMAQMGLRQADLRPFIGSASKVARILSGRQPLTPELVPTLVQHLDIPADLLAGPGDP